MQRIICGLTLALLGHIAFGAESTGNTEITSSAVGASSVVRGDVDAPAKIALQSAWGLNDTEIRRLAVVREIAGPHVDLNMISPIELLGIYAETNDERIKYARQFIRAQQTHRVKSMEWAIAVASISSTEPNTYAVSSRVIEEYSSHVDQELDQARYEFFKGGRYEKTNPPTAFSTKFSTLAQTIAENTITDRLVLYIEFDCQTCNTVFRLALEQVKAQKVPGVDVVFAGVVGDAHEKVSAWAVGMGITREEVTSRKITLNYETPYWRKIRKGRKPPFSTLVGSQDG